MVGPGQSLRTCISKKPPGAAAAVFMHSLSSELLDYLSMPITEMRKVNLSWYSSYLSCLPSHPPCRFRIPKALLYWASTSPFVLNIVFPSFMYPSEDCPWITQLSLSHGYKFAGPLQPPWIAFTPYLYNVDAISASFLFSINPIQSAFCFPRYLKISGP